MMGRSGMEVEKPSAAATRDGAKYWQCNRVWTRLWFKDTMPAFETIASHIGLPAHYVVHGNISFISHHP